MIEITDSAATKIKDLLQEQGKSDHALRIFVRGMSCSGPAYGMALDNEPRDDDNSLEFDGLKVLVDPLSAQYVEGAQVDWVDGLMGRGFTVVNPTYQAERRWRRLRQRRLLLRTLTHFRLPCSLPSGVTPYRGRGRSAHAPGAASLPRRP